MRRFRKYLALTPAGRAIVLRSLLLLPVVAVFLRTRGMARTMAWLGRRRQRHGGGDPCGLPPQDIARLIDAAASLLRVWCLPRSLLLWHFLRARDTAAELRFGVARPERGGLRAHAWVELDGVPINDRADVIKHYAPLQCLDGQIGLVFRRRPLHS